MNMLIAIRLPAGVPVLIAEMHWGYWLCLAAAGVFLLWLGWQQKNKIEKISGGALLAILLLWVVLSAILVSPAERLYQAHQDLADAATRHDVRAILNFFESGVNIPVIKYGQGQTAEEQIESRLKLYGIKNNTIQNVDIQISGPSAITQLRILTQSDFGPVQTTWRLEWADQPQSDWRIVGIDLLKVGDRPLGMLPEPGM